MSLINITQIEMLNNPTPFEAPISLRVTFECLKEIPEGTSPFYTLYS